MLCMLEQGDVSGTNVKVRRFKKRYFLMFLRLVTSRGSTLSKANNG
jgi:hypothetical protein